MTIKVFDNIELLNAYLERKNRKNVELQIKSFVVGERKLPEGKVWDIVDRFFLVEN